MTYYEEDLGATDLTGRYIKEGDRIIIGSNSGLRVGTVVKVTSHHRALYYGNKSEYGYSVSVDLELPTERKFTFPHDTMGREKFLVVSDG